MMMKSHRVLFPLPALLLVLGLILASPAFAGYTAETSPPAEAIPDFIARAPGAAEYPHDDGLILKQETTITLLPDGRIARRYLTAMKVLQEHPMRSRQCDPMLPWDDGRQDLQVFKSRTWMADGTPRDTQANGFNEITPFALEHMADYTRVRQLVATFVGMEHGATAVLDYEVRDREPDGLPFWGVVDLQRDMPVLEQRVVVEVPAGTALRWQALGAEVEPRVEQGAEIVETDPRTAPTGGGGGAVAVDRYIFERRGVPAANVQEGTHRDEYLQRLVFSTASGWGEVRRLLASRLAAAFEPGELVRSRTAELTRECALPLEKALALHRFVAADLRGIEWGLADFGFTPRTSERVLETSGGHRLDRAVLLVAMLRAAGLEGEVIFASPASRLAADVPTPQQLEDVWVRARVDGRLLWLDPSATLEERDPHDLEGCRLLALDGGEEPPVEVPLTPADRNFSSLRGTVTLAAEGHGLAVTGTLDVDMAAHYNPLREFSRAGEATDGFAAEAAGSLWEAKVKKVVVAGLAPEQASLRLELEGGKIDAPRTRPFAVPLPFPPGSVTADPALELHRLTRTTPLLIPGPLHETTSLEIAWPKEIEPVYLPEPVTLSNRVGELKLSAVDDGEGKIRFTRDLTVNRRVVPPELYPELRQLLLAQLGERNAALYFQWKP